jgi:hypothetical protein
MALPIHTKELKKVLQRWLDETDVKCACAVGVKNYTRQNNIENPRVYIASGKTVQEPTDKVEPGQAAAAFFTKTEYTLKGTSGCLCYDIGETDYMAAVMWRIPFSETLSENCFNIRCLKKGECNRALFDELSKTCKTANGELITEENGFRVCGCFGRESKALLIIDLYDSVSLGALSTAEPVKIADIEAELQSWLSDCAVSVACGIGVSNYSGHQLRDPKSFIIFGRSCVDPPRATNHSYAAPSMYCKREYSLTGTSGVLTYDIKDTENMLVIVWMVPVTQILIDNMFQVAVMKKANCDCGLYKQLITGSHSAKNGVQIREELGFQVSARMGTVSHATLIVEIHPKQKPWSLW